MSIDNTKAKNVIVLGAGLAGLTASYQLSKAGLNTLVIERDSKVGGLAKTLEHNGLKSLFWLWASRNLFHRRVRKGGASTRIGG